MTTKDLFEYGLGTGLRLKPTGGGVRIQEQLPVWLFRSGGGVRIREEDETDRPSPAATFAKSISP